MNTVFNIFLVLHIASGFTALGTGLTAIVTRKGGKSHKKSGKVYYWSMLGVSVSSFALSLLHTNHFLFMVGLLSLYLTVSGNRSLLFKRKDFRATRTDWGLAIFCGIGVAALVGYLLSRIPITHGMMPVIVVFATVLLAHVLRDGLWYAGKVKRPSNYWLRRHIGRMMGAYIATTTAFVVVNVQTDPMWIAWLAPTVLFTPLGTYFERKFTPRRKKAKMNAAAGA